MPAVLAIGAPRLVRLLAMAAVRLLLAALGFALGVATAAARLRGQEVAEGVRVNRVLLLEATFLELAVLALG